jgi:hypothetical protein
MAVTDIADFVSPPRAPERTTSALAEMALDKCQQTLLWGDWDRFRYWHEVYLRERNRLGGDRS